VRVVLNEIFVSAAHLDVSKLGTGVVWHLIGPRSAPRGGIAISMVYDNAEERLGCQIDKAPQ
jgi:hypothetical protein